MNLSCQQITNGKGRRIVMLVGDRNIDRRVINEARTLSNAGWDVTVVAGRPPRSTSGTIGEENSTAENFEIVRINEQSTKEREALVDLAQLKKITDYFPPWPWHHVLVDYWHFLIEAVSRPAAIYVGHDLPLLAVAVYAAVYHSAKLVYDAHELYPEDNHPTPDHVELFRSMDRFLSPFATTVITVNQSAAREMEQRYEIPRPHVILNCPEVCGAPTPFKKGHEFHRLFRLGRETRVLLYQGTLGLKTRNLESIICAMAHVTHKDVALVLMGPGDTDAAVQELIYLAKQKGVLGNSVFFSQPVSQAELIERTASADAGIIPYPRTTLNTIYCTPNKLFDYIASGVPILANDSPELIRFVRDQGVGMNAPMTDLAEIAEGINAFFASDLSIWRDKLAQIASQHTWQSQEALLLSIYNTVAESSDTHHAPNNIN